MNTYKVIVQFKAHGDIVVVTIRSHLGTAEKVANSIYFDMNKNNFFQLDAQIFRSDDVRSISVEEVRPSVSEVVAQGLRQFQQTGDDLNG